MCHADTVVAASRQPGLLLLCIHEMFPEVFLLLQRLGEELFGLSITAIPPNCYLYYSLRLSLPTGSVTVLILQCAQHTFFKSLRVPCIKSISIPPNATN